MNETLNEANGEVSLRELAGKIKIYLFYLLSQWLKLVVFGLIGAICAYAIAYSKPITYAARLSFVVEEGKSAGSISSIAGQFGLDIGSSSGGGGLLYGENLLLFLKSQDLSRDVLLSAYDSASNYTLADKYADRYGFSEKWAKNRKIGKVNFPFVRSQPFSRLQDSLLQSMVLYILKKELLVERPEKKATFINVECTMRDELLSKFYCERLVQRAVDRYIQSKTNRQRTNVDRLQTRADSLAAALNNKTFFNASEQEKILDLNPSARTSGVRAEVSTRDKIMLSTIYGEVVKNLEIAKVQLSQETPSIQIVDTVNLPLRNIRTSKMLYSILGLFIGTFATAFFLLVKKMFF